MPDPIPAASHSSVALVISPQGHPRAEPSDDPVPLPGARAERIAAAFASTSGSDRTGRSGPARRHLRLVRPPNAGGRGPGRRVRNRVVTRCGDRRPGATFPRKGIAPEEAQPGKTSSAGTWQGDPKRSRQARAGTQAEIQVGNEEEITARGFALFGSGRAAKPRAANPKSPHPLYVKIGRSRRTRLTKSFCARSTARTFLYAAGASSRSSAARASSNNVSTIWPRR